jgi:hypothetical protein
VVTSAISTSADPSATTALGGSAASKDNGGGGLNDVKQSKNVNKNGGVIGIVIGIVLILLIVIAVLVCKHRRNQSYLLARAGHLSNFAVAPTRGQQGFVNPKYATAGSQDGPYYLAEAPPTTGPTYIALGGVVDRRPTLVNEAYKGMEPAQGEPLAVGHSNPTYSATQHMLAAGGGSGPATGSFGGGGGSQIYEAAPVTATSGGGAIVYGTTLEAPMASTAHDGSSPLVQAQQGAGASATPQLGEQLANRTGAAPVRALSGAEVGSTSDWTVGRQHEPEFHSLVKRPSETSIV